MKSNFKLFLFLVAGVGLAWYGCQSQTVPITAYNAPISVVDRSLVVNFDSGSATINPLLFEVGTPGNVLKVPGSVVITNNFAAYENATLSITGPGANNTPMACNVSGAVTDKADGKYPAVDLQAAMEWGNKYDMSFFSGVKFYYKIGSDDTAAKRVFQIPIFETQAPPGGNCDNSANKCYDHFGTTLAGTNGAWQLFSAKFTDLTRQGFGNSLNPPNLTAFNLSQVLWLQWEEGNSNNGKTATIDFWVDEIQFF